MGFFSTSKKEEPAPEWLAEASEIKTRIFAFFDKLEAKMQELCEAAIPELNETHKTDEDIYKRSYGRMLSGIKGQIENIRDKARATYEEKVSDFYDDVNSDISVMSPHHSALVDFRTACSDRYNAFEDKSNTWHDALTATGQEDLELKYQALLEEYETIRNKFTCKQCGGGIVIDKMYFITTYLICPHCQTQNTFEPSTAARGLEDLGRNLAEQRTQALSDAYEAEKAMERTLYHERHTLSLRSIDEDDKKQVAALNAQMDALEAKRQASIKNAPILYKKYLRAMFDEWNKIVPDLTEQNNKFHDRILEDFMRGHS